MKKILALLAISLVMCLVFAANVFAADEIVPGYYVRFNSQAAVDKHVTSGNEKALNYAYDEDEGALFYTYKSDGSQSGDHHIKLFFDEGVKTTSADPDSGYDYFRVTYYVPTADKGNQPNGLKISNFDSSAVAYWSYNADRPYKDNFSTEFPHNRCVSSSLAMSSGKMVTAVYGPLSEKSSGGGVDPLKYIHDVRLDIPNQINAGANGGYCEVYIYDFGFFKSEADAKAFNMNTTKGDGADWTFAFTAFKDAAGNTINAKIAQDETNSNKWTVKFPIGTVISDVVPVFTTTSTATDADVTVNTTKYSDSDATDNYANVVHGTSTSKRAAPVLYEHGELSTMTAMTSGSTKIDLSKYTDGSATFLLYQKGAVLEYIELDFSVETKEDIDTTHYIRFNSQDEVNQHITSASNDKFSYAYDEEEGALFCAIKTSESANTDSYLNVIFDSGVFVDAKKYDYCRFTYRILTKGYINEPNGLYDMDNSSRQSNVYFKNNAGNVASLAYTLTADNKVHNAVLSPVSSKWESVYGIRFDILNLVTAGEYFEIYIYDIGFFETESAAKNYPCDLETKQKNGADWSFVLTGFNDADGNLIEGTKIGRVTDGDDTKWSVVFPFGTDTTAVAPIFTKSTSYSYKSRAMNVYEKGERVNRTTVSASGTTPINFMNYASRGSVDLNIYQEGAIYEYVNIAFSSAEAGDSDKVDDIVKKIGELDYPVLLRGADTRQVVEQYLKDAVAIPLSIYPGAIGEIDITSFTAPIQNYSGNNYNDGTDGSITFTVDVTLNEANKKSEVITASIHACGYPIVFNFASPVLVSDMDISAASMEARIIKDEGALGGAYTRIVKLDDSNNEFNVFLRPNGIKRLPQNMDLKDYPIFVIRARASVDSSATYVYAPSKAHTGWSAEHTNFYLSPKDSTNDFVKNDGTWTTMIQDFSTVGYWESVVNEFRFSFMRGTNKRETVDIDYIAFFNNRAQAEAFIANPWMYYDEAPENVEEAVANVEELDGYTITAAELGSTAVGTYVKNLVAEKLAGYTEDKDYYVAFRKTENSVRSGNYLSDYYTAFTVVFTDNVINAAFAETCEINIKVAGAPVNMDMLGAQLRVSGERAIRFGVKVNVPTSSAIAESILNTDVNKFADLGITAEEGTTVTFGTLVVPKEALIAEQKDASRLTHELIGGDNKLSGTAFSSNDTFKYDYDYDVIDDEAENVYEVAADGSSFVYTTVVTGIPEGSEEVSLVARAYAKITDAQGNVTYVYSNPIERSFNALSNQWSEKTIFDDDCNK